MHWLGGSEKCALGRGSAVQRPDEGRENAGVRGGDHQLSGSLNDGDVDVGTAVLVAACSAFGPALVFDDVEPPSGDLFAFGLSDHTEAHQYCEQKEDTTIL